MVNDPVNQNQTRLLNHFSFFKFQHFFFDLPSEKKSQVIQHLGRELQDVAAKSFFYQVYPTSASVDFMVWSALEAGKPGDERPFFAQFARATNRFRQWIQPEEIYWGYTRPSQYSRARSTQEVDPINGQRQPYLVVYPFVKTSSWYLMSRDARQGMMNEHIRIGKQYPDIKQLLLYSFGLQDQEFVVVYEMGDLTVFSDLVQGLRQSEGRRFTERDTPLFTAIYQSADQFEELWSGVA